MSTNIKEIQKDLIYILRTIDTICQKENIIYMIQGGTLLGAIREKGFIEWDDDADIMMHRNEFIAFEEKCIHQLGNYGLFLDFHDRVPKVALIKNPNIHVDIFLIDLLPVSKISRKYKAFKLKLLQGMLKTDINYSKYSLIGKLLVFGSLGLGRFFTQTQLLNSYKKTSLLGSKENSNLISVSNELYRFMDLEWNTEFLKYTIRIQFENIELLAPKEWDTYLKIYYGEDYMVPKRENFYV
jgi:lipopolysaccharide cholinephosphotransferase